MSRTTGFLLGGLMICAAMTVTIAAAQEDASALIVDGSAVLEPAARRAAEDKPAIQLSDPFGGTDAGFDAFCAGPNTINAAVRPISPREAAQCALNDIDWVELRAGYLARVVVAAPGTEFPTCLTVDELAQAWTDGAEATRLVVTPLLDEAIATHMFAVLGTPGDQLVEAEVGEDAAAVRALLDASAIGLVDYHRDYEPNADRFGLIEVDAGDGCVAPDEAHIRDARYPFAQALYVYVRADALDNSTVVEYLGALLDVSPEDGIIAPDDADMEINRATIDAVATGRVFSMQGAALPDTLDGTVMLGSHPALYPFAFGVAQAFNVRYADVDVNIAVQTDRGEDVTALTEVCAGEADIAMFPRLPDDAAPSDCAADLVTLDIGYLAVTMLTTPGNDVVDCLTLDELRSAWQPESEDTITGWEQIRDTLPERGMFLCGIEADRYLFDFFTATVVGEAGAVRLDYTPGTAEQLVRCAGETITPAAGLIFMDYGTYAARRATLHPLAVDSGAGCMLPGQASIRTGRYALAQPVALAVRADALENDAVFAFVQSLLMETTNPDMMPEELYIIPPSRAARQDNLVRLLEAAGR